MDDAALLSRSLPGRRAFFNLSQDLQACGGAQHFDEARPSCKGRHRLRLDEPAEPADIELVEQHSLRLSVLLQSKSFRSRPPRCAWLTPQTHDLWPTDFLSNFRYILQHVQQRLDPANDVRSQLQTIDAGLSFQANMHLVHAQA